QRAPASVQRAELGVKLHQGLTGNGGLGHAFLLVLTRTSRLASASRAERCERGGQRSLLWKSGVGSSLSGISPYSGRSSAQSSSTTPSFASASRRWMRLLISLVR